MCPRHNQRFNKWFSNTINSLNKDRKAYNNFCIKLLIMHFIRNHNGYTFQTAHLSRNSKLWIFSILTTTLYNQMKHTGNQPVNLLSTTWTNKFSKRKVIKIIKLSLASLCYWTPTFSTVLSTGPFNLMEHNSQIQWLKWSSNLLTTT